MAAYKGYFDGRTIVLDGPLEPAPLQRVLVHVEPLNDGAAAQAAPTPARGVGGDRLLRFAGAISHEDLAAMTDAIREGCERIDRDEW